MLLAPFGVVLAAGALFTAFAPPASPIRTAYAVQLAALDPGEAYPGGRATTKRASANRNAFSQPSNGIGFEGKFNFKIGNALFRKFWVASPASTKSSDGLGPLYNSRSCQTCHLKDGRGHPPTANFPADDAVSMFLRLSIPPQTDEHRQLLKERRVNVIHEPTYGGQLQDLAVPGFDAEGRMHITYETVEVKLADGTRVMLRKPTYEVRDLKHGPLHSQTMLSPRIAPQMIGLGLLDAIPDEAILANADPNDADGDGISGRPNEVWSLIDGRKAIGRFGWKAGNPNVHQQSAEAFAGDMGLSTSLFPAPFGECSAYQTACRNAHHGDDPASNTPEITDQMLELVTFYSQNLAVPARRNPQDLKVRAGKSIFANLGCASCHTPSFTTGKLANNPHLSNQRIWPYTDLLLHDMGAGLADGRPEGVATGREWRTPPLWGIGLTQTVSGHTFFLHDGRARNVEEAILWHGGEAKSSRDAYAELSKADREALLAFVNSL
ncbi:MAG: di-heme oxidoredictase family protein [Pseudomonadota bacterium]